MRLLALTGALAVALAAAGSAAGSFKGQPGKIAYGRGTGAIYTANPDGSYAHQIAPADTGSVAEWSPDGARILYIHAGTEFWTMWANGTDLRLLVKDVGSGGGPRWSPDGRWIAYTATEGLAVIHPDGSGRLQLTTGPYDTEPSWSPDSKWIAFSVQDNGVRTLAVVRANGTGFHTLRPADLPILYSDPRWSPVDDRIAFTGTLPVGDHDIFTIRANGTDLVDITPEAHDQLYPSWSHGGSRIGYVTDPAQLDHDPYRAAIVASDGSSHWVDPLFQAVGRVWDWAPDDSSLLVESGGGLTLGTMDPTSGHIVWGPSTSYMGGQFDWQALNPGLRMVGASGHDQLLGSAKNDEIYGRGGPDSLAGGNG
ncbi:MAG: TolB protein, partial [Gaiellaceae bacterium]|nr:TolB protein [Gaiellaceae bacterium]